MCHKIKVWKISGPSGFLILCLHHHGMSHVKTTFKIYHIPAKEILFRVNADPLKHNLFINIRTQLTVRFIPTPLQVKIRHFSVSQAVRTFICLSVYVYYVSSEMWIQPKDCCTICFYNMLHLQQSLTISSLCLCANSA